MSRLTETQRVQIICLALALVTLALYWRVSGHEFVDYDDNLYVYTNRVIGQGLTWGGIKWAFTELHGEGTYWHPLTWLSHMIDVELFGMNPAGHHLGNVLLHVVNSLLLFLGLRWMTGATLRAAAVAALFAWHPFQVDTVAWVAERKNLLSTLFGLLTIGSYVRFCEAPAARRYAVVMALFALGLMTKPVLVTLPCALWLLDFWPLRRWKNPRVENAAKTPARFPAFPFSRLFVEKLPLLALSAASSAMTIASHHKMDAVMTGEIISLSNRLQNALVSYAAYARKTVWPSDLAVVYPHPGAWPTATVALSALVVVALSVGVVAVARRVPAVLCGWCWFLGMLVPTIGVVQAGIQAMADRFVYFPLVGIFTGVVWIGAEMVRGQAARMAWALKVCSAVLLVCVVMSWRQISHWENSTALFAHAVRVVKDNHLAHLYLGSALVRDGRVDDAIANFTEALRIRPTSYDAWNSLGNALSRQGKFSEAFRAYSESLKFNPRFADAYNGAGFALAGMKRPAEAVEQYAAALRLRRDFPEAHFNFASVLDTLGRTAEAQEHFTTAIRQSPNMAEARTALGGLSARQGKFVEAIAQFGEVVRLQPDDPDAHLRLGMALAAEQKTELAMASFREALRLRPETPQAMVALATVLATHPNIRYRNGKEALEFARRANQLSGGENPIHLDALAAALAEVGEFAEAATVEAKALRLASGAGVKELAAQMQQRLQLYQAGKPFRQSAGLPGNQ
jgi:tetratricopeptide (TPR) repeat protein